MTYDEILKCLKEMQKLQRKQLTDDKTKADAAHGAWVEVAKAVRPQVREMLAAALKAGLVTTLDCDLSYLEETVRSEGHVLFIGTKGER